MSSPRLTWPSRSFNVRAGRLAALLAVLACAWLLTSSQAFAIPAERPGVGDTLAAPSATFTVTALDDHDDGTCDTDCTLIEAINAANVASGANTVVLPVNATFLLTQVNNSTPGLGANGLPVVTSNLTVTGNGAVIARDSAAPDFRFFQVGAGASLTLNQVTLLNGSATVGASLGRDGGCLLETGSGGVTLYQSSLEDCTAADEGGAVYSDTSLTLDSSTVSMTSTTAHTVVVNGGSALIRNSTLTGNTGSTGLVVNAGTVSVIETTITANNAGLIINGGTVTVTESLIGGNTVSQVVGSYTDGAGNYIGAAPQLSALRYWGGPTKTHYPLPGSPARNISGGCAWATDQRGARRPGFGNAFCDAGAVETSDFAVTTTADSGPGSLRQAILDANSTLDLQVIYFNIGAGGVQTVQPTDANPLPDITDPVVIDGLTQGGSANTGTTSLNADLRVEIDGSLLTTDVNGLRLAAPNNVIRGLVINRVAPAGFFVNADGIEVASTGNRIEGNTIGTNAAGTVAQPNSYAGIRVLADNNIIGGRTADAKNLLSGNTNQGVYVSNASNNAVQGNFIGVDAAATASLGQGYGVSVVLGGSNNTVGGPLVGQRNVISGHAFAGVYTVSPSTQTRIIGNYIGTTATGNTALGNQDGIQINDGDNNIIGGPVGTTPGGACTGDCNLLSGNSGRGIYLFSGADNNEVQGNYIGVNVLGTVAVPNGSQGFYQEGSGTGTLIGGATPNTRNVIAGNSGEGILLTAGTSDHMVVGNYIGVYADGVTTGSNGGAGIHLASVSAITIGGTTGTTPGGACTGACNVIAGNTGPGIQVETSSDTTVQGNFIGTDVSGVLARGNAGAGVVLDDSDFSTIGGTTASARNLISANANAGVHILNTNARNNVVQGNFIGTDTSGTASLGNLGPGIHIESASSNRVGGTTGTTPGGACTGACNLIAKNSIGLYIDMSESAGTQVQGNFIGTDVSGTARLANISEGILVNDAPDTVIGGTTPAARNLISANGTFGIQIANFNASGAIVQGNFIGVDTTGLARLGNGNHGILIAGAPSTTVGGTTGVTPGGACTGACNVIADNARNGITITGAFATDNVVVGNFIGTNKDGTGAFGNDIGVYIAGGANNNRLGTNGDGNADTAERNLVSGNASPGVLIQGTGTDNNVVAGNYIGVDTTGLAGLGNDDGVWLDSGAQNNRVGTDGGDDAWNSAERNVIAGNTGSGVLLVGPNTNGNVVAGNYVGVDAAGSAALPNQAYGVAMMLGSQNNRVGTNSDGVADAAERNVIAGNLLDGVYISDASSSGNLVAGNIIGADATGAVNLPNLSTGVYIVSASNNTIGGTAPGAGNVIRGNTREGVVVRFATATGNAILGNSISQNGALGIDLNPTAVDPTGDGVTPNDAGDTDSGPNGLQNFPQLRQVTANESDTFVLGTLGSQANATFRVEFFANTACDPSGNGEGGTYLGFTNVTTDGAGTAPLALTLPFTVPVGSFITATATNAGNNTSEFSACRTAIGANTSWSRATRIPLSLMAGPPRLAGQTGQYLTTPGGSAWFKFTIQPHAEVTIDLSDLSADYDLALYRDPNIEYNRLTQPITAVEIAARAAPEGFLPEGFLPEGFLPEGFLPEGFLPEGFLPEGFLPEGFLPEGFLRERFRPGDGAPASVQPEPYALAELTSLLAVSAGEGTRSERILRNTYATQGDWYIQVRAKPGVSSLATPFALRVEVRGDLCAGLTPLSGPDPVPPAGPGSYKTLILTNLSRLPGSAGEKADLQTALTTFMARSEVNGVLVDLGAQLGGNPVYPRVAQAYTNALDNLNCPLAKNILAQEIKKVVDAYRQVHPLEYVVLIGDDNVIPFFRGPDQGGLADENNYYPPVLENTHAQSSLRLSQTLGQDEYGSSITAVRNGFSVPLPDLAVGRLVETAAEATVMLNTYLDHNGVLVPASGLVTGYDFVADVANAVKEELNTGLATTVDSLIQPQGQPPTAPSAWTAAQLRTAFLDSRHDITFFAGHFSAVGAEAADYRTRLSSAEVAESSVDLANAFVYSVGCHSGYNIPSASGVPDVTQEPDWAQTFARKGVTSVMGTGYQYGDTEFIEYSERLYYLLTRRLRTGDGPRPVGKALVQAKLDYLAAIPQMRGLHEKALRVATLYGLPMYSINMPGPRLASSFPPSLVTSVSPVTSGPGVPYLLSTADITVTTNVVSQTKTLVNTSDNTSVTTTYFKGRDGVVVNPLEPVLPLQIDNVTYPDSGSPKQTLRGVGWRGGPYTDYPGLTPLTGAPTTELSRPHPAFGSAGFYPSLLWSVNYFDAFSGGKTLLDLFPAQFRSDALGSTTGVFRTYGKLKFRLFYSNETGPAGMAPPPTVTSVQATLNANTVHFTVLVDGQASAGVQQAWILYTATSGPLYGEWRVLDLSTVAPKAAAAQTWTGALALPAGQSPTSLVFVVQAANGVGGVTLDTNGGQQYSIQVGDPAPPPTLPTSLTLSRPPAGAYRDSRTFTATLTQDGAPVPNQTVQFRLGGTLREAQTDASGVAVFPITITQLPNSYEVSVEFKGGGRYLPSLATDTYLVEKQGTSISLSSSENLPVTRQYSDPTTFGAVLDDDAGRPIAAKTVFFVLSGPGGQDAVHDITTHEGRATMEAPVLPSGTYSITAYFAGALPAVTGQDPIEDARYLPSSSTAATSAFIITPETASVAYTGPTSLLVGSALQLTATVGQQDDGYPGDLRLAQVRFVVKNSQNGVVATRTVNADSSGRVTETVASLAVGAYTVETQVQGGYFASPLVSTPLVVTAPTTQTPTPTATATATKTATVTATATATVTRTPVPNATATGTATPTAALTATVTPTRTPTRIPVAPSKPAVFRNGTWFLRTTLTDGPAELVFGYGLAYDVPLMCDWDGNGSRTPGVFRNGAWYLKNTNTGGVSDTALLYGLAGDLPICGDWDGDGTETVGVVRGNAWYLRNSNTSGFADVVIAYGVVSDKPVVGDWNGDGVDTPGVFRDGVWFFRNSNTNGMADLFFSYGMPPGDTAIVGDWNGDGVDTPGVLRGSLWLLRNSNTPGMADVSFSYGAPGDKMLVWR